MGQYAAQIVDANALQKEMATKISAALESSMKAYMEQVMATITAKTQASVQKVMGEHGGRAFLWPCPWTRTPSRTPSK